MCSLFVGFGVDAVLALLCVFTVGLVLTLGVECAVLELLYLMMF